MPQRTLNPIATRLLLLFPLLTLLPASSVTSVATNPYYVNCSRPIRCGHRDVEVSYPFRLRDSPDYCGVPGYELNCSDVDSKLTINLSGNDYAVNEIDYDGGFLTVVDADFVGNSCPKAFTNTSTNSTPFDFMDVDFNVIVYVNCTIPLVPGLSEILCLGDLLGTHSYYMVQNGPPSFLLDLMGFCNLTAVLPLYQTAANLLNSTSKKFSDALQQGFRLTWSAGKDWCKGCVDTGGVCGYNSTETSKPTCFCSNNTTLGSCPYGSKHNGSSKTGLIFGLSTAGGVSFILLFSLCFLIYRCRKKKQNSSDRSISFAISSKTDPELGSSLYPPIFSYHELYEATNGFDAAKELGDGGFGTVYKGKLKDGRVVAVKLLYESNYRRLEQFINEIKILSLLRHQNLVTLYGCTSHRSRELILVYEFVPNGTVADHLHGSLSSDSVLNWQTRMSIAIETADALNYLHSIQPQIIHRDVKTDNILLDNSFHVKVADFGLSRLFPPHTTHVSTAPQGTPGYVDPEYHQSYQLTDKSDVYSFGVVLMELISSKPAFDISRDRSEVILANMAIKKIQRQELPEFVDPRLGYQSDYSINGMINQVAELAFQCLLPEREVRPCIKEVLEILQGIESGGWKNEACEEADVVVKEGARLLKMSDPPYSPNSVADRWVSTESSMSSFSG